MRFTLTIALLATFALLALLPTEAEAKKRRDYDWYSLRIVGSYNYTSREPEPEGTDSMGYGGGIQFFERTGALKGAGVELVSRTLYTDENGPFETLAFGLVLERVFIDNWIASFGGHGYFGSPEYNGAFFGLSVGLGYETQLTDLSSLYLMVRRDLIYADPEMSSWHFLGGLGLNF